MRLAKWVWVVVAFFTPLSARPARACSIAADGIWIDDIPANGIVTVRGQCSFAPCFGGKVPETVQIGRMDTGEQVPGVLLASFSDTPSYGYFAVRPSEALEEGVRYRVTWEGMDAAAGLELVNTFTALAPAPLSAMDVEMSVALERIEGLGDGSFDCEALLTDSCGGSVTSVSLRERSLMRLELSLGQGQQPWYPMQVALRTAFWADGEAEPELGEETWPPFLAESSLEFLERQDAYCYRIEARSLVDDSVRMLTDCIAHGTQRDVGVTDLPMARVQEMLASCKQAPKGLEAAWCAGTASACDEAASQGFERPGCRELDAQCADVMAMDVGNDSLPAPTAGEPPDGADSEKRAVHGRACAVAAPGVASPPLLPALLLCAWAAARRRRGTHRATGQRSMPR